MKYMVGYEKEGKFVILFEGNNLRIARIMAQKFSELRKEIIKLKKRA